MRNLYLVKRGPKPAYQRSPYHRVLITPYRNVARQQAGWSGDRAWLWSHEAAGEGGGWLLERWYGLDIDYGHVVRGLELPGGTQAAFSHGQHTEPRTLLREAMWWCTRPAPAWLIEAGVRFPEDEYTQRRIIEDDRTDGQTRGAADWRDVERPAFWPVGKVVCSNCADYYHSPRLHAPPVCARPPVDLNVQVRRVRWKRSDLHTPNEAPSLYEIHERWGRVAGIFIVHSNGTLGRVDDRGVTPVLIQLEGVPEEVSA